MIKLPLEFVTPKASFTWFISGTEQNGHIPNMSISYTRGEDIVVEKLNKIKIILDSVASIKCNVEYSAVEFNIPKINTFCVLSTMENIVQKIIRNEVRKLDFIDESEYTGKCLLGGIKDEPYIYDVSKLKILVVLENKKEQQRIISALSDMKIKAVKLTRANVDKFSREDVQVCVAGNLFGVNMGFLTHIVINIRDFTDSGISQIIGRGQRLSRKQNLQVYFRENEMSECLSGEDM
jgi:hypothetical protein